MSESKPTWIIYWTSLISSTEQRALFELKVADKIQRQINLVINTLTHWWPHKIIFLVVKLGELGPTHPIIRNRPPYTCMPVSTSSDLNTSQKQTCVNHNIYIAYQVAQVAQSFSYASITTPFPYHNTTSLPRIAGIPMGYLTIPHSSATLSLPPYHYIHNAQYGQQDKETCLTPQHGDIARKVKCGGNVEHNMHICATLASSFSAWLSLLFTPLNKTGEG